MPDEFWNTHLTYAEAARQLGSTRQNIYQCCLRGSIPMDRDEDGHPGIPISYVNQTIKLRNRDKFEPGKQND